VANEQRKVVYQQRQELMEADDLGDAVRGIRAEVVGLVMDEYLPPQSVEELWDKEGLEKAIERDFGVRVDVVGWLERDSSIDENHLRRLVLEAIEQDYERKAQELGPELVRELEKGIMLRQLDLHWKEHIAALDYLRQGIHLRGYAQRDPKQEYKREAFELFSATLERVKHDAISILSKIQIRRPEDVQAVEPGAPDPNTLRFQHAAAPSLVAPPPPPPAGAGAPMGRPGTGPMAEAEPMTPYVREQPKVGRNQPCPCGSGKKYKQCHGRLG
jgi:preprotein translocase subunit SecA